ncbi:MAG: cation:proton antiporter [Planctomycetes bacterium]|nr:cation:proton antiporter [Planctomycetota bacterium]
MPFLALIDDTAAPIAESSSGVLLDLALIMCVAAVTTLLFQRLRQPVVLGYLLAGFLLGPHLFANLIEEHGTLEFLSQLGVILLMYSLGLEFRLRKLRSLGPSAAFVSVLEVGVMLWLGFSIAHVLGWSAREALFAGGILAISSTTLIRKVFNEREVERATRELVTGVLVYEDLIAILLLAGLTAVATGERLELVSVGQSAGRLLLFVALVLAVGKVFVPRLVRATVALGRRETLLITALGVCFAGSIVALRAGYSVALGAFLAGSLVAESGHGERIDKLVEPVRDMFAALFFVSVGMLIDPVPLRDHWRTVLLLALLVVGGKVLGVSLGAFLSGKAPRSALRSGLCMAQVGEFSFIIAGLGVSSGATRPEFYPLAVGVSLLTAFVSPILIANAERISNLAAGALPGRLATFARLYSGWLHSIRSQSSRSTRWGVVRSTVLVVMLDAVVLSTLVITGALAHQQMATLLKDKVAIAPILAQSVVILVVVLLCVLPLLGLVRGSRRLGVALAALAMPVGGRDHGFMARRALTAGLQVAVLLVVALPALLVTEPFLPGFTALGLLSVLVVMSISMIWRSTGELQGQVRAGAHVIAEALGHLGRRETIPVDDVACLLPSQGANVRVPIPLDHPAGGSTLAELGLSSQRRLTVLAITRGKRRFVLPGGNARIFGGDEVDLAGSPTALGEVLHGLDLWAEAAHSAITEE